MTCDINTLFWDNVSPGVIDAHRRVIGHFGLTVKYTNESVSHGQWMDRVIRQSTADVVGFLDCDCVPLARQVIERAVDYAFEHASFIGTAQVSNHIPPSSHVFAAPAFFFIERSCYNRLNTSMVETDRSDVAEELSYAAEAAGLVYRALYPTHFSCEPKNGAWRLGNYGVYGIGTVFANAVYHHFQCRHRRYTNLFVEQCQRIIDGTFVTDAMFDATGRAHLRDTDRARLASSDGMPHQKALA